MCNSFIERNKNAVYEFGMVQGKSYCLNDDLGIFLPLPTLEGGSKAIVFHLGNALEENPLLPHILTLTHVLDDLTVHRQDH